MKLESAKCPNCGATLQLDPGASTAVCDFCHSTFSVKDALAYNGESKKEYRLKMADDCLEKGVIDEAVKIYSEISKEFPNDYRGWFGIIKCCPVSTTSLSPMTNEYNKAIAFASGENQKEIEEHRKNREELIEKYKRFNELTGIINKYRKNKSSAEYEVAKTRGLMTEKELEIGNVNQQISQIQEQSNKSKKKNRILLILSLIIIVAAVITFFISEGVAICLVIAALVCLSSVFSNYMDAKDNNAVIKSIKDEKLSVAEGGYAGLKEILAENESDFSKVCEELKNAEAEKENLAEELGIK